MNSLVSYSGSSSDEEEDETSSCVKRCAQSQGTMAETEMSQLNNLNLKRRRPADCHDRKDDQDGPEKHSKRQEQGPPASCLPLPGAILGMFGNREQGEKTSDDPSQHGGRLRSFPHMEGNWASFVHIPVSPDERLNCLMDELLLCLRHLNFERMDDLHISLSRTVCIRHHWIQPLTESLKATFQQRESCLCDVGPLKVYTNDEKTRTFLSLEIKAEESELMEYISAVDACFREFNLPGFYENPSFHVSLMWCVGDVMSQITEKTKKKMQKVASDFFITHTDLSVVPVNQVLLKTGNKTFAFHLRNALE